MNAQHTKGFTIIEGAILVVVVSLVTVLGLVAYNRFIVKPADTTTSTAPTTSTSTTAVTSPSDLEKVGADLNSIDLTDTSDTSTISTQASAF